MWIKSYKCFRKREISTKFAGNPQYKYETSEGCWRQNRKRYHQIEQRRKVIAQNDCWENELQPSRHADVRHQRFGVEARTKAREETARNF